MKNISIIGATGSIGTQALDIIRQEKDSFILMAFSVHSNYKKAIEIIDEFNPKYATVTDINAYEPLKEYCNKNNIKTELLYGMDGLNTIASLNEVDMVLTSVVGMIGLEPTLKAIKAKKDIALANKETLVVAGELVMKEAQKNGVHILPVDSEHNAIFQCLQGNRREDLDKIILTASGGPFRGRKLSELQNVKVEEALKHPNWSMGKKITIDSATLMNKGLEVIEAKWLFDTDYENIEVVVHPQSVIHSMVQYKDGSIIAELGSADMRLPIQYALNHPFRKKAIVEKLDFSKISTLTFEKPDLETFKCLKLAYEAGKVGGLMPTIMNAANEVCVDLFLRGRIKFLDISNIIEESMDELNHNEEINLENIFIKDKETRQFILNKCL